MSRSSRSAKHLLLALCSTLVITFVIETLVTLLLSGLPPRSVWAEALIDSSLLAILAFPTLYFFVLGPLATHAAKREQAERALVESEARYRSLFANLLNGFAYCRMEYDEASRPIDFVYLDVNTAFERLTGLTGVVGKRVTDVIPGIRQVSPELFDAYGRVASTGIPETFEFNFKSRDQWLTVSAYSPATGYFVAVFDDITERKRADDSVRLQSAALNAAANPMVITDRDGTIEWVNAALTASVGYEASEVVGKNPRDLFRSGVHDQAFYKHLWETLLARAVWRGEMVNRRKDGSLYTEDMTITPIASVDGAITHFIAVKQDITERKRSEEQLREQAELLDHAQDAIIVRDLEHRITYWNKSAERLYGWTAADAVGRSVPDVFYKNPAVFHEAHDSVLHTGEWTGELQQLNKDGHEVSVESRWTLVRDRSGAPKSVLVINTDITERKRLEQQFLRAQRLESLGTLAGGIAHDLNNVLAPIVMSIDLLKMTAADDDSRALLDTIAASAHRGADMVAQVLSFARGVEGRKVNVQVRHLIREIEKIARKTFPKNIRIGTTVSRDLWTVLGDPTQLHQVLLNLCINARDAMPQGGQITISAENVTFDAKYAALNIEMAAGPYVVMQVEDTGTGIPQAIIDKVFDPFFTTKEVGKGTGLGLSTSLTIVKHHGGFLRVYSEPGAGTRFRIGLPALPDSHDTGAGAAAVELPRGDGETVLVVDDEASIREITRQTLEAFGYRVLVASDGSEAVALYAQRSEEIAVVLTDMMMPVMDGGSAIQVLVKMNPAIRIIAASGLAASQQALPKTEAGAIHFLLKPYSADTLLQTLRQALAKERQGHLDIFE
jgi:PAS domain S-box-containing protein